ncbi:melanoma-associated antigen B5-like [Mastomys coucha]|uniref:melanoma-associated antigen B5-like n=1 Tax=Mastomys coucha TaxID=35658 RepID=UPI0012616CD5|nr:melanoma-associated antigen B5-like [Mastomys coucha]
MPRGQKNKHHRNRLKNKKHNKEKGHPKEDESHEKGHNKIDDSQDHKEAQESVAIDENPPCSSNSVPGEVLEKLPASEKNSDAGCHSRVTSPVTVCGDDLEYDGTYCHCGGNSLYSEYRTCQENPCQLCLAMYVSFVEQFVLYKFKMKQLIARTDLINLIEPKDQYRFNEIFKRAFENIEIVFAARVIEIDTTNHFYDLVSKLKLPNKGRVCAGRGLPKTGLLMTILAMIFMNGNSASEEDIWKFLNNMQVYPGRKHFIFREPRKLITQDFIKLKYLEYKQIPNSDPPCYQFQWGPKAYTETTKMEVLQFMAKGSGVEASTFSVQYAEALREENQKAKIRNQYPTLALKHCPGHGHHHVQKVMKPQ